MIIYWFYPNLHMNSFGKMGQLALSPVSCFSSLPWFPGGSPLPHLVREILVLPGQVSWWEERRHHPGPCLSPSAQLTPRLCPESSCIYGLDQLSSGLLSFLLFFLSDLDKKKEIGWLTMLEAFLLALKQHNAVKFCNLFGCFFFSNSDARWHCSLRLCVPWIILVLFPNQLGIDQEISF